MTRSARNGFTLVELLLVLVIVVVLIGMMLPAVRRVREPANRMKCANSLKQLMFAFLSYEDSGRSAAAPAANSPDVVARQPFPPGCQGSGATPEERLSWVVALLPFMEQESLYRKFDLGKGYAANLPAAQTRLPWLLCPSSKELADDAVTHYVGLAGIGRDAAPRPAGAGGNGFMGYDRLTSTALIKDGTSNTIALTETRVDLGPWARGGPSTLRGFDPGGVSPQGDRPPFGSHHAGGMNVAMADGSVRFLPASIDPERLAGLITIAGGERVDLP